MEQLQLAFEIDPNGRSSKEPGAKLDSGKLLADDVLRMFARALWAVCEVGTFGAKKYTLGGWLEVPNGFQRYSNAQMRHRLKEWIGEVSDPDSQLKHLAHEAWNALARLELYLREAESKPSS